MTQFGLEKLISLGKLRNTPSKKDTLDLLTST